MKKREYAWPIGPCELTTLKLKSLQYKQFFRTSFRIGWKGAGGSWLISLANVQSLLNYQFLIIWFSIRFLKCFKLQSSSGIPRSFVRWPPLHLSTLVVFFFKFRDKFLIVINFFPWSLLVIHMYLIKISVFF